MSYFRKRSALGDGPITSPSQVDDSQVIGQIAPTRVDCATLPADSPWRQPGQPCAPSTGLSSLLDYFGGMFGKGAQAAVTDVTGAPTTAPDTGTSPSTLLLLAGAGGLAYYLLTKKKGHS